MASNKFFTLAVVVAAATVATRSAPTPTTRSIALSAAMNRTVCPIQIVNTSDKYRIPRKIQELKCAPNPQKVCRHQGIPENECCHHNHNNHVMECVEIFDNVLVYKKNATNPDQKPWPDSIKVSVGCVCMIEPNHLADTLQAPT